MSSYLIIKAAQFRGIFYAMRGPAAYCAVAMLWGGGVGVAQAQAVYAAQAPLATQGVEAEYQRIALQWARGAAKDATPTSDTPLKLDVSVGGLDPRLRLAPCSNVEAYLPPGARFWGHSRVGLRCVDGVAKWNVSLPMTVKATGKAWVVRTTVASGATLGQNDVMEAEVDWAEETNPVVQGVENWLGQTANRPLSTGQTLRQGMLRPSQVFQPGALVRVVAEGAGFQASADAQALSAGVVGQPARVRMDNGRITSGVVLDSHTVKVEL